MDYEKLDACYNKLKDNSALTFESISVVRAVHEFREFWQPKNVKVILLAESHVYTNDKEWGILLKPNSFLPNYYPNHFVRFVYNIAYGENHLLNKLPVKNWGTFQYWELFYSCLNNVKINNYDFSPILKTGTVDNNARIRNKINLLNNMKDKGIWLVDTSIVGINGLKKLDARQKIIESCWENYNCDLIKSLKPKHVIVIGKTVADVIGKELDKMAVQWSWRYQPQARKPSAVHHAAFDHYYNICSNCI
jgi:hypothetical protein